MDLNFPVTCKKCGHEHRGPGLRPRDDAACPACGAIYAKVEAAIAAAQAIPSKSASPKLPPTWGERPFTLAFGVLAAATLLVILFVGFGAQKRSTNPDPDAVHGDNLQARVQRGFWPWTCPDLTGLYLWDQRATVAGHSSQALWRPPLGISPERAELKFSGPTDRALTVSYREMPPNKNRGVNSDHAGMHRYTSVRCTDGWVELLGYVEKQEVRVETAFGLATDGRLISRQTAFFKDGLTLGNLYLDLGYYAFARYAVHERLSAPMDERPLSDREWNAWKSDWKSKPAVESGR